MEGELGRLTGPLFWGVMDTRIDVTNPEDQLYAFVPHSEPTAPRNQ